MLHNRLSLSRNSVLWQWFIYAIVAEVGPQEFVVKIGRTNDPGTRYKTLLTAIPFKSVMLFAPMREQRLSVLLETKLHQAFAPWHSRGEWFRFPLNQKAFFHNATRSHYRRLADEPLTWRRMTEDEAHALAGLHRQALKKMARSRNTLREYGDSR